MQTVSRCHIAAEPVTDLLEKVGLTTTAMEYQWVHTRLIWAVGTIEFATGKIHITGHMQSVVWRTNDANALALTSRHHAARFFAQSDGYGSHA